jgi:hypothetical protein
MDLQAIPSKRKPFSWWRISALLIVVAIVSIAFPGIASASGNTNEIRYLSSAANNVCVYGYNQNNTYTVHCLNISSQPVYTDDPDWWWQGRVTIIWSFYDTYLNTTTCTMDTPWWEGHWTGCAESQST